MLLHSIPISKNTVKLYGPIFLLEWGNDITQGLIVEFTRFKPLDVWKNFVVASSNEQWLTLIIVWYHNQRNTLV